LLLDEGSNEVILGCDFTHDFADFGGSNDYDKKVRCPGARCARHVTPLQTNSFKDADRWETAKRETLEETLSLVSLGSRRDHSLGDTVVHPDGIVPSDRDSGYKCYLVRLPPAVAHHFCRKFDEKCAAAVAQMVRGGKKPEVSKCVRFPVAHVVEAVKRNGSKRIESQKGQALDIRDRTWKVR